MAVNLSSTSQPHRNEWSRGRCHPRTDGRSCQIPVWHFCEGSLKKTRIKATATMNIGTTMLSIIKTINAALISLRSVNI